MTEVNEIRKNIYRIKVLLPNSPLGYLNSYFIRGEDEDYLIDTGFNRPECEEALRGGLEKIGAKQERINIINTHLHADHCGQNFKFIGENKHVFMTETDLKYQKFWYQANSETRSDRSAKEGASRELIEDMSRNAPGIKFRSMYMFDKTIGVPDGYVIHTGDYDLEFVLVPGHTIGNCMLWCEKEKLMFTGDHVLFDISPNITFWPNVEDALGMYLASLKKSFDYPVEEALPGHRESGNYHYRINALLGHHERRLAQIEDIIGNSEKPLNAFEITAQMKWKVHRNPDGSMPNTQLWFASGECIAHLDYLVLNGRIKRNESEAVNTYSLI